MSLPPEVTDGPVGEPRLLTLEGRSVLAIGYVKDGRRAHIIGEAVVRCSTCRARVGHGCRTPSGAEADPHLVRIRRAKDLLDRLRAERPGFECSAPDCGFTANHVGLAEGHEHAHPGHEVFELD